jgi:hypothetical protein
MALVPWRNPMAIHDPAKLGTDVAVTLALGRNCLADIVLLRVGPAVFGRVTPDPTVLRTMDALTADRCYEAVPGCDRLGPGSRTVHGMGVAG